MADERSDLERRLIARADRIREEFGWEMTPALLREAAERIGEMRRAMQAAIDDDMGMSGYRLLEFQALIDRLENER